jgi:hypothetical protein
MTANTTYERDFHAWTLEQAVLLRSGRLAEADIANIAEEIESMGRSERREPLGRLDVLLTHLLKWQFQPGFRATSWELMIREQRRALLSVQQQTGLAEGAFPARCPYAQAEIFADSFLPD